MNIPLMSVLGKVFTPVLNNRLTNWANMRDKISEVQSGFRKKYSTIDHIFTLYAVVQKCLSRRKHKLYVAFIDLKKAFDTVNHYKLYYCLRRAGLRGKMFNILISMYSNINSCVCSDYGITDFFDCPSGLRQGCILCPLLFSFFSSELYHEISSNGKHGLQMYPDTLEILMLHFGDDVILLSDTVIGL